ncbi:MAG TPA: hypothetical protein ENN77_02835 [Candidatus Wirthbacteria bacterium]|nr:hypothetical protein [Candidatus Wirthbacteria bacterium]
MLDNFIKTHLQISTYQNLPFRRYLYEQVNWQARAIAIIGARGVGKTTMLFQYAQANFADPAKCLYVLGDDTDLLQVGLPSLVEQFSMLGGQVLMIDEIHKYPNWAQIVKNIYDKYPGLRLIISGSSQIDIKREKYDLSRRLTTYTLPGLSVREFVNWETGSEFTPFKLADLLTDPLACSRQIVDQLASLNREKIIQLFKQYLEYGYYPYYRESRQDFQSKLRNAMDKVLYEDIPVVNDLTTNSVVILKKILALIGSRQPFEVDITSMANTLQITRPTVYAYLDYLTDAELLIQAHPAGTGKRLVRKPAKLYLQNPNLYQMAGNLLGYQSKSGTIREAFAINQLSTGHRVAVPKQGDFLVDEKYTLEIGGAHKKDTQLKGLANGYLVCDDLEYGFEHKIPLYLLGFLY